jgi:hypothetical protein
VGGSPTRPKPSQEEGGRLGPVCWVEQKAFEVVFIFNLVDWLILDWLIFCVITPRFIIIPGTEGMAGYKDFFSLSGFSDRKFLLALAGLIIATIVFFL